MVLSFLLINCLGYRLFMDVIVNQGAENTSDDLLSIVRLMFSNAYYHRKIGESIPDLDNPPDHGFQVRDCSCV